MGDFDSPVSLCRLGYEEDDGARYCFEHYGFTPHPGILTCDRASQRATPKPRPPPRDSLFPIRVSCDEKACVE